MGDSLSEGFFHEKAVRVIAHERLSAETFAYVGTMLSFCAISSSLSALALNHFSLEPSIKNRLSPYQIIGLSGIIVAIAGLSRNGVAGILSSQKPLRLLWTSLLLSLAVSAEITSMYFGGLSFVQIAISF